MSQVDFYVLPEGGKRELFACALILVSDNGAENVPIVIGTGGNMGNQIPEHTPIMINLADQIPHDSGKIERILEIVAGNESERQQARKRYAEYRDQGHVLNKHDI